MSQTAQALVLAVFVLATSVWVGGYVALAVVARSARATLDPAGRVLFFRSLGRSYLRVGLSALVISLATGAVLLRNHDWDALLIVTTVVAAVLVVLLAVAIAQARKMSLLRGRALEVADDRLAAQVSRSGRNAGILRVALGLLTLTLVVLGAFLAT